MIGFDNYYSLRDALPVVPGSITYMVGIGLVAFLALILGRRLWSHLPAQAKLGLGLALLAIAPLLISRYTGMRLMYLSSAFLAFAFAAVIGWRRNCPIMTWVAAVWVVAMSLSWVERATAWQEAGQKNEIILDDAVRVRKHTPDNTASVYLNVPRRHIGAFLFPGAFAEAVRWRVQMPTGLIFDYDDPYTDKQQVPASRMWYRWDGSRFAEVTEPVTRPAGVDP
jgi:hypothetical protein